MEIGLLGTGMHSDPDDHLPLSSLINEFESISLSELDETKARLLTRIESKHLMTLGQCREFVRTLGGAYRVLEIQDIRIGRYETLYYDTPMFLTYLQHHNRKGNRYKLRLRHYDTSDETYLEVKKKNNKGSTEKSRIRTSWSSSGFSLEQVAFLRAAFPYDSRVFHPVLWTVYNRLTLVSKKIPERITLDTGISFGDGQKVLSFPDLVIGEIKHDKGVKNSPALLALHAQSIRKRAFSKYCIGISLLYSWLKHNRFKENLIYLSKLSGGGRTAC
ncbi:MAG: VTC domain protein [Euryarchaeota archaeon ADurb.BinA087]|nr:MAG: VTC domain protein [Euryarchaeota archaeon ADurb.BinA087]